MDHNVFYTLQEFLLHSESVTYIVMGLSLVGIVGYWLFITARDND